jgi:chromosome segregation ATPase
MKKYLILLLIPLLFACGRAAKKEAEALKARNDSLLAQTVQKDEAINEFIRSVNDVQQMLDTIKMKENLINLSTQQSGELQVSAKDQIKNDITSIYGLLLKNKHQLDVLTRQLKASGMKVTELQVMVARLTKDIAEKNKQIEVLRDKLAKMDIVVETTNLKLDTLTNIVKTQTNQLNDQSQTISDQDAVLNTAYYIIGTSKELSKNGVIGKGDRILGDFNKSLFTKIDVRKVTEISILSKKAKVLSNHPTTSYKLTGDKKIVQALEITDYKAFWSNVKYLVILVN